MKQWMKTGIFTVLITGMVFLSGCLGPVSTGAEPVTPPATPIVNETVPATLAPTPTTAVPASKTLITPPETLTTTQTTAVPTTKDTGYNESNYDDTDPPHTLSVEDVTGSLFIHIRSGGSQEGVKVFIARDGTNVSPIDYSYRSDRTLVEGQNTGYLPVKILPDGSSEVVRLTPGNYTAYLPDMNGGEPEHQSFMISAKGTALIWLSGFSASGGGGCGC